MVLKHVNALVVVPKQTSIQRLEIDDALSQLNRVIQKAVRAGATDQELHVVALREIQNVRNLYKKET